MLDEGDYEFDPMDGSVRLLDLSPQAAEYEIDFVAGYGESGLDVPQPLRLAIRLLGDALVRAPLGRRHGRRVRGDAARLSRAGGALSEACAVLSRRGRERGRAAAAAARAGEGGGDARRGGGATLAWSAAATVFADVTPVRAEERRGDEVSDATLHRIVIRHRDDVEAGDRFRLGERLFAIRSVTDPDEDGRFLVCMAEEEGGHELGCARLQEAVFAAERRCGA